RPRRPALFSSSLTASRRVYVSRRAPAERCRWWRYESRPCRAAGCSCQAWTVAVDNTVSQILEIKVTPVTRGDDAERFRRRGTGPPATRGGTTGRTARPAGPAGPTADPCPAAGGATGHQGISVIKSVIYE